MSHPARFPGFQRWSAMPTQMHCAWYMLTLCLTGWAAAIWLSLPPAH